MGELAEEVASTLRNRGYEVESRAFDKSTLLTADGQGERRVVLVYPGRERSVDESLVEKLADVREKAGADVAEITTLGGVTGPAQATARRYDVTVTDADDYCGRPKREPRGGRSAGGRGNGQPVQGGGQPPGNGGQAPREGTQQRGGGGQQRRGGQQRSGGQPGVQSSGGAAGRSGGDGGMAARGGSPGAATGSGLDVDTTAVVGSAVLGALTFALGYVLTYLLKSGRISSTRAAGSGPSTEQYVAWLFYEMHNVGHVVTRTLNGRSQSQSFNPSTWGVWESWLLAVPPLLLVVAGVAVAYVWSEGDPKLGAVYGAALTAGYFPLAGLLAVLSEHQESVSGFRGTGSITAGPKLVEAAVLAGVLYPVVFGVVGGLAVAVLRERSGSPGAAGGQGEPEPGRRPPNAPPQGGRQQRSDEPDRSQ